MAWSSTMIFAWLYRCTPRVRRYWCKSATAAKIRSGGTWKAAWSATPEYLCAWTRDITRNAVSRRRSATRMRRRRGGISTTTITSWYGCGEHAIHSQDSHLLSRAATWSVILTEVALKAPLLNKGLAVRANKSIDSGGLLIVYQRIFVQ